MKVHPIMKTFVFIALLMSCYKGFSQSYPTTTRFTDREAGISFEVPYGWLAHPIKGGYMIQSEAYDGYVMILPHYFSTLKVLKASYENGLSDSAHGIKLTRSTAFEHVKGRGVKAYFEGIFAWRKSKCCMISLMSPFYYEGGTGGANIISGNTNQQDFRYFCKIAQEVAKSVKFNQSYGFLVKN